MKKTDRADNINISGIYGSLEFELIKNNGVDLRINTKDPCRTEPHSRVGEKCYGRA